MVGRRGGVVLRLEASSAHRSLRVVNFDKHVFQLAMHLPQQFFSRYSPGLQKLSEGLFTSWDDSS